MNKKRDDFHRWLFERKQGHEVKFTQKSMPFAVFKENAEWGGSCQVGDVKCRIRIRHNSSGEKGKRLEVWFPHSEYGKKVPYEESTLVGYIKISGNWRDGTGVCLFEPYKENNEDKLKV